MGTAGGEPRVLLNALKPMLGVVGDIKTPQEVMRVVGMMKDAEKLMSRCIYLNILRATCKQATTNEVKKETLQKFLATGGWGILNKWLVEFMKAENFPVLLELIDVLQVLPITVDLLKQGNTGKIMKSMTKLEHADVKKNASGLIKQWKSMIRGPSHVHKHHSKTHGNEAETADQDDKKSDDKKAEDKKSEDKNSDDKKSDDKKTDDKKLEDKKAETADSNGKHDVTDERIKRKLSTDPTKASDSSGFMTACFMSAPAPMKKKRRHNSTETPASTSSASTNAGTTKKTATHLPLDEILKDAPPIEKKETKEEEKVELDEVERVEEDYTSLIYHSPAVEAANAALAQDTDTSVVIDEGSLARKRHKPKRNITWASDDKLVQVSYFEVQPGEKKDRHAENFSEARQLDLQLEKQAWKAARFGDDRMVAKVEWRCLIPVDGAGVPGFTSGEKSKQKFVQDEREKTVLAYIYLTGQSLPDSPVEPDFDPNEMKRTPQQPVMIPHDDNGGVMPPAKPPSTKPQAHRQPQNTPPVVQSSGSQISLSPNVQEIMSQLLGTNNTNSNNNAVNNNNINNSNNSNAPTISQPVTPHMMHPKPPPAPSGSPGSAQQYSHFPPNNNPNIPPPNMGNNNNVQQPWQDVAQPLMDMRGGHARGGGPRYQGTGRGFNNGDGGFPAQGPGPGHHGGRWNGGPRHHGPPPPDFERGGFRGGRGARGGPPNNYGPPHRGGDHRGYRHGGGDFNRGRGRGGHNDRGGSHRGRGGYHEDGRGSHHRSNRDSQHHNNR